MNIKFLLLGLGLGASILAGCNDDLSSIGTSIQPGNDTISVYSDTFRIQASTVKLDSIYARSTSAQLGQLYDPLYGNLISDFMCQFYCPSDFEFKHEPYEGKIDSVDFRIFYDGPTNPSGVWMGDSLAPMRAEIFKISTPLKKNFYTNINPEEYCDMQTSLGSKAYTAYNSSISDEERYSGTYHPCVTIPMPYELGQRFYEETKKNPATFKNQDSFNEFFPGIYVTNTFGSGNILSVSRALMSIYYQYSSKTAAGKDTLLRAAESFSSTKEVIQLNRFKNTDLDQMLQPNDQFTFFKTPAGVCTKLVFPTTEIAGVMEGRIVNNVPLKIKAMPQEDWKFPLIAPPYLLALPEDSVKGFFENSEIENNMTSFLSNMYDPSTRTYAFPNLANMIKDHMDKDPENNLRVLLIPVHREASINNSYWGQSTSTTSRITNYMAPAGVKIRKDEEATKISITSSRYAK